MFSFFTKEPPPETPVPVRFDINGGLYHGVHEIKRQPDVGGAHDYAWESLALAEFSPIGWATVRREQWMITAPEGAYFPNQQLLDTGLPTNAGQLVGQPLFDPSGSGSGFTPPDYSASMGLPSSLRWNDVAMYGFQDRKNDPNPINRRGV